MPKVALPGQFAVAQIVVQLAALAVLFTRDARAWVDGRPGGAPPRGPLHPGIT